MSQESSVIQAIKTVMPGVVSIVIEKSLTDLEKEMPPEMAIPFALPGKNQKLKMKPQKIPKELADAHGMVKVGGGSGFVVAKEGIVVTNKHVVADPKAEYIILGNDGRKFEATVLARDPIDDVAILKIQSNEPLATVALGDSLKIELGQSVLAIGNALGVFRNTVSSGIISGLSRSIRAATDIDPMTAPQELRGLIQTDAAINPGNSGGPLVNLVGEAIGINAAIVFGAQNLGFAIPVNAIKRDLADLATHGRIRRPLLGLRYLTLDEMLQNRLKLPVAEGAIILGHLPHAEAIIPGSPAYKAGLKEKDIIIECNSQKLSAERTIQDFLEEKEVGDTLELKVLRGKKQFVTKVVLTERK